MNCATCHQPIDGDVCNFADGLSYHRGPVCCPSCVFEDLDDGDSHESIVGAISALGRKDTQ